MSGPDSSLRDSLAIASREPRRQQGDQSGGHRGSPGRLCSGTSRPSRREARRPGSSSFAESTSVMGNCDAPHANAVLENVIARGTSADLSVVTAGPCGTPAASITVSYSNYRTTEESGAGTIDRGVGNQTSDALTNHDAIFADDTRYRQLETAPTRNAGVPAPSDAGFVDPDGHPRVGEGRVDIGADELPAPPSLDTIAPSALGATSADLTGRVDGNGEGVRYRFEYGTTPALRDHDGGAADRIHVAHAGPADGHRPGAEHDVLLPDSGPTERPPAAGGGRRHDVVHHAAGVCSRDHGSAGASHRRDVRIAARPPGPDGTRNDVAVRLGSDRKLRLFEWCRPMQARARRRYRSGSRSTASSPTRRITTARRPRATSRRRSGRTGRSRRRG